MSVRNNKRRSNKNYSKKQSSSNRKSQDKSEVGNTDKTPADDSKEKIVPEDDSGSNDPTWYSKFPELLDAADNVPFSNPFGYLYDQLRESGLLYEGTKMLVKYSTSDAAQRFTEPGIAVVFVKPSMGGACESDDAVNVAAHLLYGDVRAKNSGARNYDQNDLMMYVLAVSELIGYIMWAKRLYCAAFVQSQRSLYVNKLLESLGGDSSLIENLAQFRSWINLFIAKMSTLVVPANIELFKRRAFLYETIYTEDPNGNIMDQMYAYSPACFMKFAYDTSHVGCLVPEFGPKGKLVDALQTLDDIIAIGQSLLENIVGNTDFAIMAGDILKFCEGNILTVALQEAEGVIAPVHDAFVLAQIHNADIIDGLMISDTQYFSSGVPTTLGAGATTVTYKVRNSITDPTQLKTVSYGSVWQDGLGLIQAKESCILSRTTVPYISNSILHDSYRTILSPDGDMSPEYVVESTRLKCILEGDFLADNLATATFATVRCGTDIVVTVRSYTLARNLDATNNTWNYQLWATPAIDGNYLFVKYENHSTVGGVLSFNDILRRINSIVHSKWSPYVMLLTGNITTNSTDGTHEIDIMREIPLTNGETFSVQTNKVIRRLHDVCWLSLTCANSRALV